MITNSLKGVVVTTDAVAVDVTVAAGNLAVLRNRWPFLWPKLSSSSVYLESGANLSIAPAPKVSRFSLSQDRPRWHGVEIDGQFWIDTTTTTTARHLYQLQSNEWQSFGKYSSPPAALATAYTLSGGDSAAVDAAMFATGNGGQLVLSGSITLTRPISLEYAGFIGNLTIVFSSATVTYAGVSITQPTPVLTSASYPADAFTLNPPTIDNQSLVKDLLVSGSFAR